MNSSFRAIGARARQGALRTILIAGAASVGTGLLLAACSGSAMSGGGSGAAPQHAANGAAGIPGKAAAPRQVARALYGAEARARLALSTQSIIYTAELSVRVRKDVTGTAARASSLVTAVGGYVASEQEIIPPGRHRVPQINLELKIPVAQYRQTVARLSGLGRKISFSQRAENVTQQVADVSSRVASAQAAIRQLRALLTKAGSVSQLLSVQEEINSQESNLEALLAQQRALAHETSYATVTVILVGHHARIVAKHKKASPGFLAGLRGGWHALVLVVGWALTALGSALPFLIPAALIGGIAIGSRRRLARRKNPPAAEPPPAAAS